MNQTEGCYFRRQRDGWAPVPDEAQRLMKECESDAIAANCGPGIGHCYTGMTIDNVAIQYVVRVTWDLSIHYCEIHFPSGEECQVHFSSTGDVPDFPGNWRHAQG